MTAESASATAMTAHAERRMLVIWNPAAGLPTRLRGGTVDDVRDVLEAHDIRADIAEPGDEDGARAVVRRAVAEAVDVVVAAGGDGTVRLVAEELLDTRTALGILPLGRVMNVARSLGIERDIDAAAEVLATGEIRTIDTGEAITTDGQVIPFLEAGSVGLNAAIFREATRADEGDHASILRTIWVALRYRPARITVHLDDEDVSTRALMVSASVGPYLGLGMTVAPGARLDDGHFDVTVFRTYSKVELLRHLVSISFGRRRYTPKARTYRSSEVRITSMHPLPARADGVDLGHTPVAYRTRPRALRVVVPRKGQSITDSSTEGSVRRRM